MLKTGCVTEMTVISPDVQLSLEATKLLLSRYVSENERYDNWPSNRDERIGSDTEVEEVCRQIASQTSDSGKGFSIIKLDPDAIKNKHQITVALWNLFTCFTVPINQFRSGFMLHRIEKSSDSPPPRCSFSMSSKSADLHTDGTYIHKVTPRYLGLICIAQAKTGGQSILVDGRKIYEQLKSGYPEELNNLSREYHFYSDNQLKGEKTIKRNILTNHNSKIQFNYHRNNINLGYELTGETLDRDAESSINTLDKLLAQKEYQYMFRLNQGEMLVHNNHFILHGRKSFEDGAEKESKRLLIRLWGNKRI